MEQNSPSSTEPIIPPFLLLGAAALGFLVALGSFFINSAPGFAGYAGLVVGVLSLVFWALTNPQSVRDILRGRFFQFGGTALVVTLVLGLALVLIYALVRQQGWRADLSQSGNFSLDDNGRQVVELLGQDPTTPNIRITAFYGAAQAASRELAAVFLDDIASRSGGKITYTFVDPDRDPLLAQRFNATAGQSAIALLDENGEPDAENAKLISSLDQQTVLDALITVTASGDFRAYFLAVEDGVSITDSTGGGASIFAAELRDKYGWQVEEVSALDILSGRVDLNAAADGSVLIIPGGRAALPDEQAAAITQYIDGGGSVVLFADFTLQGNDVATAPNINNYLTEKFGITVNNDLVLDPQNRLPQDRTTLITGNFGPSSLVEGYDSQRNGLILSTPHSITLAATPPANVTLTPIVSTFEGAYAKAGVDFASLTNEQLGQAAGDATGPFVLGAQAVNSETGAQVIVFGTPSLLYNAYRQYEATGGRNFDLSRRIVFAAAGYENFAASLASLPTTTTPQQQPIFASQEQLNTINFLAIIALPLAILLAGGAVWWQRRERAA
jgi:hypothetical protein